MVQPSGPVQLRPEFEKSAVWLFNGHHGNDKAVTTLGSFRATIEKSFPTADASMLAGSVGQFGIRDESGSNFVGSGFDLAAYKTYLQPSSHAAILVVFRHIYVASSSAQVWFSSHNRYNNQYGYRFDIQTGTNNLRWWTGNAAWTWNITATDVLTEGTRYAAMGMSFPLAGQKDMSAWLGGRRVAHDNSLADFTITYSGAASDPTMLGAHYDSAAFSLGTTPIGPVEMIVQFGSGLSYGLAQALTIDPYQIFLPDRRRRIYVPSSPAGGALAGTAALAFGEGTSSLTGGGALAGAAALTFDDGASTLTASGALAGSATVTFGEGASSLTATGTLTGQIDLTFDDGASALTGAGALAGAAALVFANTGALTDLAAGSIAGTAALTFTDTGTVTGAGALAGSSAITFTTAATAAGAGALSGAAALTFTNAGDLTNATSGAITGTAGLVFAEVAALTGAGALAGSAAMQLTASAVISGGAFVTADRRFIAPTRSRSFNLSRSRVFRSE